jgi:hypothetical protein
MSYVLKQSNNQVAVSGAWNPVLFAKHTGASFPAQVPQSYVWTENGFDLRWVDDPPAPTPTLAEAQSTKRSEVNTLRDAKEVGGFMYQGKLFQSDERSAQRIVNAAMTASSMIMASQPFSVTWLSDDDTEFVLDGAGMLALQGAFTQFAGSLHTYGRSLKDQINAATTVAEVAAIDITTGWPA